MAELGFEFVASQVEDSEFELFAPGDYTVTIIGSEVKDTKSGTGKMLKLEYQIEGSNRKYFDQINFLNENPTAQKIGQQTLKKIASAVGLEKFSNSDVLTGKRMVITISQKMGNPYQDKYGNDQPARMQNNVSAYHAVGASQTTVATTATGVNPVRKNPFAK